MNDNLGFWSRIKYYYHVFQEARYKRKWAKIYKKSRLEDGCSDESQHSIVYSPRRKLGLFGTNKMYRLADVVPVRKDLDIIKIEM